MWVTVADEDRALVIDDNVVDNGEAEAATPEVAGSCGIEANKSFEHAVAFLGGNARAIVGDDKSHGVADASETNDDAIVRVLFGVVNEVADHSL